MAVFVNADNNLRAHIMPVDRQDLHARQIAFLGATDVQRSRMANLGSLRLRSLRPCGAGDPFLHRQGLGEPGVPPCPGCAGRAVQRRLDVIEGEADRRHPGPGR